jgi:hypothetical protein
MRLSSLSGPPAPHSPSCQPISIQLSGLEKLGQMTQPLRLLEPILSTYNCSATLS